MSYRRRMAWCGLLCSLGVLLGGCWDQRPVESRAAVSAIAIGPTRHPGWYRYTFVFPNVTTTPSSLATTPSSQQFYHLTVTAPTLGEALTAAQLRQSRLLYLGQVRIVALSVRLPSAVWRATLEDMVQSGRFVLTYWLVGSRQAERVATLAPPSEVVPEVAVYRALSCHCQPLLWSDRAWRVWTRTVTPGDTAWVPNVEAMGDHFTLTGLDMLTPHGVSVWAWPATWGWGYLTGHVQNGTLTGQGTSGQRPWVLTRLHGSTHLTFVSSPRGVTVTDVLQYRGTLAGGGADAEPGSRAVQEAAARQITALAWGAIRRARTERVDPFGWHRDWGWTDAEAAATHPSWGRSWAAWHVQVRVTVAIANDGVLR